MLLAIPRVVKVDLVVEVSWWTTENAPVRARNKAESRVQNEASSVCVMVTNKSIDNDSILFLYKVQAKRMVEYTDPSKECDNDASKECDKSNGRGERWRENKLKTYPLSAVCKVSRPMIEQDREFILSSEHP
jgi:hypothetical protein